MNRRTDDTQGGGVERGEFAVGVKVFTRTDRLEALLASVPRSVSTVYVADDGPADGKEERRKRLYDGQYPFELVVLDLEYDTGVGYGRRRIVEGFTEEYLLMLDSDMRVPNNAGVLLELLQSRPDLGGVSGCIAEPPYHRITMLAADFEEDGDVVTLSPFHREKEIRFVEGYPLLEFDFIPNVALFRRDCLEEYSWDPNYEMEFDHQDFYLGHWKRTEWSFGVCPQVIFPHYPGGDDDYFRDRWCEQGRGKELILEKWGYDAFDVVDYYWFDGGRKPGADPIQRDVDLRVSNLDSTLERVKQNYNLDSKLERAKRIYSERGALTLARRVPPYVKHEVHDRLLK